VPAAEKPVAGGNVSASAPPDPASVAPTAVEPVAPQPPPPPQKTFEELVVSADSVIGLRIESTVSSEVAKVEDPVEARVTRDVRIGSEVAIPSGSRVLGSVILVERGGKMKNAARIGVRFHTLALSDGTRMPMHTEAIYREGKSPGQESAAKVGGAAVGGAILGAIIGGGKGAAIGGAVGAAGGTGVVMAGGRNPAVLASGTSLTVRLSQPVTIVVEREELRN
jgi:type IV secretory pathway VirB10-like protein